jgi:hypothetical protein
MWMLSESSLHVAERFRRYRRATGLSIEIEATLESRFSSGCAMQNRHYGRCVIEPQLTHIDSMACNEFGERRLHPNVVFLIGPDQQCPDGHAG